VEKRLSRRDFLKLAGITAGSLVAGKTIEKFTEPTAFDILQTEGALTKDGAKNILFKLDEYSDLAEPYQPKEIKTIEDAELLALEAIPYFLFEGANEVGEVFPKIEMAYFGGKNVFFIGGRANCQNPFDSTVWLNHRYFNPMSPWNDGSRVVSTLIHEIGHSQWASCDVMNMDVESATEISTAEVMAGMSLHGNKHTFVPFIHQIQGFAFDYLWLQYMKEGDMKGFQEDVVSNTADNKFGIGGFDKAVRFWKGHEDDLTSILERYGSKPYIYLAESMRDPENVTRKLPLLNLNRNLVMDDTAYILKNINGLTADFIKLRQNERENIQKS